jgi:hypothetical protein
MFGFFKQTAKPARPVPAEPAGANKRAAVRVRQRFVEGRIEWPGMLHTRRCAVKDLSSMGACVELTEDDTPASKVPNAVTLQIVPDQRMIECQIVWRKGRLLGLRFTGKYTPILK